MTKKDLIGKTAHVYQKWMTRDDYEGEAVIRKVHGIEDAHALCEVEFDDGFLAHRYIMFRDVIGLKMGVRQ